MTLSAKNTSKTQYNEVQSSQSEQGDKVNLLLLSASMIFLINATVGLFVAYPKFYVINNKKCTCKEPSFGGGREGTAKAARCSTARR